MSDSSNQLMPLSLSAPGVNLGAYISTVNQIPILTAEQEKSLLSVIIMTKILMPQNAGNVAFTLRRSHCAQLCRL